jgi:hypothetical protein
MSSQRHALDAQTAGERAKPEVAKTSEPVDGVVGID